MRISTLIKSSLIITFALSLIAQPVSAEIWKPKGLPETSDNIATTLDEGWRLYGAVSSINMLDSTGSVWGKFCEQFSDDCEITRTLRAVTNRILPICASESEGNCFEGLAVQLSGSPMVRATALAPLAGYRLNPVPDLGIPEGSIPHLFEAGGQKYVVNARMVFSIKDGAARAEDMQVQVWRVKDKSDSTKKNISFEKPSAQKPNGGVEGGWDVSCAVAAENYCAEIIDFDPGTVIQTTVRVSDQVTGWLKGRLTDPEITSSKLGNFNRYVIQGAAVSVPKLYVEVPKSHPALQGADGISGVTSGSGFYQIARADSPTGISFVSAFASLAKDTAIDSQSQWYVATIGDTWDLNRCNTNKDFVGLVTTNAMAFDGDIPKFSSGFLSYNVAGLHYEPDGKTEVLGSYDLAIKSSVARCLYGYSNAPVSAQVTVTGTSGEQKVSSTIVRETQGWLTLSAKGFTFSQNQIKVKISQEAAVTPKTMSLAKFSGTASKLNAAQIKALRSAVSSAYQSAKCTVFYSSSKDKKLAQTRAAALCAEAKKLAPSLTTTAEAKLTKVKSSAGKASIALN